MPCLTPGKNALRMQLSGKQLPIKTRRTEAKHIGVKQQFCAAYAGAKRVAIVAQNAGNGAAIRI